MHCLTVELDLLLVCDLAATMKFFHASSGQQCEDKGQGARLESLLCLLTVVVDFYC